MNESIRYDVMINCLSSAQSARIEQAILDHIKYNNNLADAVKVQSSNGNIMLRIVDYVEVFPAFTYRTTPTAMINEVVDSEGIEVLVKCNNNVDAIKVANFMHYQFAGMQAYIDSDVLININNDNNNVLLFIDKKLNMEPDILFMPDAYLSHIC